MKITRREIDGKIAQKKLINLLKRSIANIQKAWYY
jgi:hypothetical protein